MQEMIASVNKEIHIAEDPLGIVSKNDFFLSLLEKLKREYLLPSRNRREYCVTPDGAFGIRGRCRHHCGKEELRDPEPPWTPIVRCFMLIYYPPETIENRGGSELQLLLVQVSPDPLCPL